MATTPSGTLTFSMIRPFSRSVVERTRPTGSGSFATCLIPSAIALILSAVSVSLSVIEAPIRPTTESTSFLFALSISSICETSASAHKIIALVFSSADNAATSFEATFARLHSSMVEFSFIAATLLLIPSVYSYYIIFQIIFLHRILCR